MTRPSKTWIEPEETAYSEIIDISSASDLPRVQIPAPGRSCVSWLRTWVSGPALVELADPGRIRFYPWAPHGAAVEKRKRELDPTSKMDLDELLELTERYRQVTIEKNGRFPIHPRELFHLGLGAGAGLKVLLLCMPDRFELWNEEFRRSWRERTVHHPPWDEEF